MLRISVILIAFLALTVFVTAEVPQLINYQGRLTDALGEPVADDTYQIKFNIYSSESGAGDSLWWSGFQSIPVTGGLFNYQLGSNAPLPDDLFSGDTTRYLGITVETNAEITPRSRLTSVAYAYQALRADTAAFAQSTSASNGWIHDGSVVRLETSTDNVGIGVTSPTHKLHVDGDMLVEGKATIGPGHTNSGSDAFVAGSGNMVSGHRSTIGGGGYNVASGPYTTVAGGKSNTASGPYYSTVGGGWGNTADGDDATIAGGALNLASGHSATIGGGDGNDASGRQAFIGGGAGNVANDTNVTVGGGTQNTASGVRSAVCGGYQNVADGGCAAIGGGQQNGAEGDYSTIPGGLENYALDEGSTVGGGMGNLASAPYSTVCGGSSSTANGFASTVCGGLTNAADSAYSFAAGRRAKAIHDGAFVWADHTDTDFSSTASDQFLIRASGGVGIGINSPQGALDVSSTTGALIVPRMTTAERDALSAVNGMIIYNTTTNQFNFYENGAWVTK